MNASLYTEFAPHVKAVSGIECLTEKRKENDLALIASKTKWDGDKISERNSVDVRYAKEKSLHDRLIIIDDKEVWLISQSFKDIAKRSPASVTRADDDVAELKAKYYRSLWDQSMPLQPAE